MCLVCVAVVYAIRYGDQEAAEPADLAWRPGLQNKCGVAILSYAAVFLYCMQASDCMEVK